MKKQSKRLIVTLSVAVAIMAAIQIAVPPIAKHYISTHGEELVGRRVEIGALWINLFTTSITAKNVTIYEPDGCSPFVSCDNFRTRIRLFPMLAKRFIIQRISFEGAEFNIVQQGESFNFDDIVEHFAGDTTAPAQPVARSWDVGIYNIGLHRSDLVYKNITVGSRWELRHLRLDIPGFYLSSENTDMGLNLDFPEGGSLASNIVYDNMHNRYELALTLKDFSIEGLLPYLKESMDVSELRGWLSADLRIKGHTDNVMDFDVSGTGVLRGFNLRDGQSREVVSADSVTTRIAGVNPAAERYLLDELSIYGIRSHYELNADSTHNFSRLMKNEPSGVQPDAAGTAAVHRKIHIGHLTVLGGRFDFTDHTPVEKFHYSINNIGVSATDFDPDRHCSITAKATLNGTGSTTVRWMGNPSDEGNHNLTVELHNIDMAAFSPYTVSMFGYPFSGGTLSFTGQNVVRDGKLDGTNHIDIYSPRLDKKRKDVKPGYKIPLRTGIYVLTDRSGHMRLDVPVSGDIDSPQFSYGRIITGAIVNTLIKAVTSPAKYIAEMMGLGGDRIEYIEIDPLQSEFNSEQYAKLGQLGKIVREKPDLRLTFTGSFNFDQAAEREALLELKRTFYLRNDPANAGMELEMIQEESVSAIDSKSKPLAAYADSLLKASGKPVRGDIVAKSKALFREKAEQRLSERMLARNMLLYSHMAARLGLPDTAFVVRTLPLDSLRCYKGRNCYAVGLNLRGESAYSGEMPAGEDE